jgi:sugar phosphate isomerase/epimerase
MTIRTIGPEDLILCAGTVANTPVLERIPAAAQAGFHGISLFTSDVQAATAAGHTLTDLRARIEDGGLFVAELDALTDWYPGAVSGDSFFVFGQEEAFTTAEAIGARSVTAVVFGAASPTREELVEGFATACDAARDHGLLVNLEFMPFSGVPRLEDALDIVRAANRPNGGIMLDVWHLFRSGGTTAAVESAASIVLGVQLDDAPETPAEDLVEETLNARLLPGDGDADAAGVVRALLAGGCTAPLGVEVFSDELNRLAVDEVARRAHRAVTRTIERARQR